MLGPCLDSPRECPNPQKRIHSATGVDEYLQGIGSDPSRGLSRLGLRVPTLTTPGFEAHGTKLRYLFQTFAIDIGPGCGLRVTGLRQSAWVGALNATGQPTEMLLGNFGQDPSRHLSNGTISWHLRVANRGEVRGVKGPLDAPNFKKRFAETGAALLYETATFNAANLNKWGAPDYYTTLTAYTPPFQGKPWGQPVGNLGTWYDIRYPQLSSGLADPGLNIVVPGPGTLIGFISVRQGGGNVDFPGTKYWAVGMDIEVENL